MKHLCYNQWGPQVQRTPHTNRERPAKRALLIVRRVEWAAITGHTLYHPYVRGREKSRKPGDILAEFRGLVEAGYTVVRVVGNKACKVLK